MIIHHRTKGVHGQFKQKQFILHLESILLNAEQGLKTRLFADTTVESHYGLTQPKQEPPLAFMRRCGRANHDGARLLVHGEISYENSENIDASAPLFNQITVFNRNHADAPYEGTFDKPPLEGCGPHWAGPSF